MHLTHVNAPLIYTSTGVFSATVVPSSYTDRCFFSTINVEEEFSTVVCLSSFFKKPLPFSRKPIGSLLLITGRGKSSLNIKHLYYCPLGILERHRISFSNNKCYQGPSSVFAFSGGPTVHKVSVRPNTRV